MKLELEQLLDIRNKYGKIIVGVDFDDTIFSFSDNPEIKRRCERTVEILKEVQKSAILCLWSVADTQTLVYKKRIAEDMGLIIQYVNESPLNQYKSLKPHFNILVDDKAGLNDVLDTLTRFITVVKNN